ncbi:MAG: hypothetical protein P8R54_28370 [Myxococcota bacterium]|nr:hypothetical protein [Myxococcota bacterium]
MLTPGEPSLRPWRPRQVVVEPEETAERAEAVSDPTQLGPLTEDSGLVALPDPPPPGPGDDLRLPNPNRWGAGSGLPSWFWIVAAMMIIGGTLVIVWEQPEYVEPAIPENIGQR